MREDNIERIRLESLKVNILKKKEKGGLGGKELISCLMFIFKSKTSFCRVEKLKYFYINSLFRYFLIIRKSTNIK